MVWFRVDDSFYDHPKVVSIPRSIRAEAVGTWTLAGDWCARHLTDGVLPIAQVEELGGTMAGALALVKAKLWTKTKTEFRFRSWAEYQPTRAQVESARESERTRKARQRAKPQESEPRPDPVPPGHLQDKGGTPGGTDAGVPPVSHQVSGHPDPTRPDHGSTDVDPSLSPDKPARRRRTPIPTDFAPNDAHRAFAAAHHLDLDGELDAFRNHALMNGRRGLDWNAGFRNWLGKAAQFAAARRPTASGGRESSLERRDRQREQMFADLDGLDAAFPKAIGA